MSVFNLNFNQKLKKCELSTKIDVTVDTRVVQLDFFCVPYNCYQMISTVLSFYSETTYIHMSISTYLETFPNIKS